MHALTVHDVMYVHISHVDRELFRRFVLIRNDNEETENTKNVSNVGLLLFRTHDNVIKVQPTQLSLQTLAFPAQF